MRALTDNEQAMLDQHTVLGPRGQPRLVIDQQSFDIDNDGHPWKWERAEWYRRQIAIALARMVYPVAAENGALHAAASDLAKALRDCRDVLAMLTDGAPGGLIERSTNVLARWETVQCANPPDRKGGAA